MTPKVHALRSTLGWPLVVAVLAITLLVVALRGPAPNRQAQPTDFATLTGAAAAVSQSAAGTNDYFLKIDGIAGESADARHKGEIDVNSWAWGVSNATKPTVPTVHRAAFANLAFTMGTTKASPPLMLAGAQGRHIKQAVLTVRKAGTSPREYFRITVSDVIVSSLQTSAASAGPVDRLGLSFAKIVIEYIPQNPDGSSAPAIRAGWNLKTNAPA